MSSENIIDIPDQTPFAKEKAGVRIKICGMKYQENIADVASLQPNYLGFIFYEKSSRFFTGIIPALPQNIKKVGVFVNASLEEIIETIAKHDLDLVQLHGKETPEFCEKLKLHYEESKNLVISIKNEGLKLSTIKDNAISSCPGIIKVFSIKDEFNFNQLKPYESSCDYFLFDTKGKLPGGNGYTFNWKVLENYPSTKPYFLSGGIGSEEVGIISEFLGRQESKYCHAIDVNSKFEIEPGLKNTTLLKIFEKKLIRFNEIN